MKNLSPPLAIPWKILSKISADSFINHTLQNIKNNSTSKFDSNALNSKDFYEKYTQMIKSNKKICIEDFDLYRNLCEIKFNDNCSEINKSDSKQSNSKIHYAINLYNLKSI